MRRCFWFLDRRLIPTKPDGDGCQKVSRKTAKRQNDKVWQAQVTFPLAGVLISCSSTIKFLVLPIMMFCFGTCTLCVAAVKNFGGLMAIRWFLGMSESAFFPLVIYYQTTFYRRGELARRLAIFYAAQSIASAFSGLLSFGVFQIHGGTLANWRYFFLIEGGCTVLFSFFAYWYLPPSGSSASFLSREEKDLARARMLLDSSSVVNEKFELKESFKIFRHPTSWAIIAIEVCLGVPLQSVQLFLPQIIARLGYSTVKTNLYTVAPNVSGAVMLLVLAFASDYTRWRWPFIAAGFVFTFIGMTVYAGIDVENQLHVAYFASFMMTCEFHAPSPFPSHIGHLA